MFKHVIGSYIEMCKSSEFEPLSESWLYRIVSQEELIWIGWYRGLWINCVSQFMWYDLLCFTYLYILLHWCNISLLRLCKICNTNELSIRD